MYLGPQSRLPALAPSRRSRNGRTATPSDPGRTPAAASIRSGIVQPVMAAHQSSMAPCEGDRPTHQVDAGNVAGYSALGNPRDGLARQPPRRGLRCDHPGRSPCRACRWRWPRRLWKASLAAGARTIPPGSREPSAVTPADDPTGIGFPEAFQRILTRPHGLGAGRAAEFCRQEVPHLARRGFGGRRASPVPPPAPDAGRRSRRKRPAGCR